MKRTIRACLGVIVTAVLAFFSTGLATAVPQPPGSNFGLHARGQREAIVIEAREKLAGTYGYPSIKPTGSSVEPPGSFRFVRCGVDTASQLRANGQAAEMATFYAEGCNNWTQGCNAVAQPNGQPEQASVRLIKLADGSWSFNGSICQQVAVAGPPRITPLMVWEQARRLISAAPIGLAPRESTLVNIQTIMWVDTAAARMLPSVVLLGQPVSIHIAIDHVGWAFGDGRADIGEGPGKPYDPQVDSCPTKQCPGYFGHVYTTRGQMTITATVTWRASFRVGGGVFTPIPGTIPGPSASAGILVREARSVLVPDPTPT
jgi:hypothetical protein